VILKSKSALLSILLLAAGPAHAQWNGTMGGVPNPAAAQAFSPAALASPTLLKRIRQDDLHGYRKVVVPFFQVEFTTGSKASSARAGASVSQSYALQGLSAEDMQAITDAVYDRFIADLQAKGFTVIPLEEARAASPNLAKLLAAAKPAPYVSRTEGGGASTFYTPHGAAIYFHQGDPELGSMSNVGSRAHWDQPAAAKELDAAVIGARFAVTFVEQTPDNRKFLGMRGSTARVNSQVELSINAVSTHLWAITPKNQPRIVGQPVEPVRFYLAAPLVLSDAPILSVVDTTSAGAKRADALGTGISMLMGGPHNYKTRAYTVTIDPVKYRAEVTEAVSAVGVTFVDKLNAEL
jgi:hypothetical protein